MGYFPGLGLRGDIMRLGLKGFAGGGTFAHGVHPPGRKHYSSDAQIEVVPAPETLLLPLQQNIGAPSKPIVKARQDVLYGDVVAKSGGFVSVPLHSPVSGKVKKSAVTTLPTGLHIEAIVIKAEENQTAGNDFYADLTGADWPKNGIGEYDPNKIAEAINNAGIVGLGGATFPTHVKFMPNDKKPVHTLLVNGCECEPYLTSDYRLMLEAPAAIITGALLAGHALGARDIVINVEDNKMDAVDALRQAAQDTIIRIAVLKTKYPQGSEKHLILALTKHEVPLGGLPSDVGMAVSNVGTIAAVAMALIKDKPLTHRVVSVTGGGVARPANLLAPIGISCGELIEFCGGLNENASRMIAGGPMMGFPFIDLETPVTKGTSGLTILTEEDVQKAEETSCVHCGRCVDVCPMRLVPTKIALAGRHKDLELARRYNIMACFECGCCAYICPAGIPLVQLIRAGKVLIAAMNKP
ncbi:Na+-translocating ferredoxin:NAD+ oxidoreductase subunit C [Desulfosarcina sp. BuS5]|nr:Na+-translocating ferredoxin:NAD+ oxidoreductase subunit C [Desulfosarcina sp. BuS5]